MAPFPEAEDMTVKRLYVALKRGDMQLLQMGAHKLHEKYHTGYKFELLDDLRQIASYIEEQTIPSDIKDLLGRTINNILSGEVPSITEETKEDTPAHPFVQDEIQTQAEANQTEEKEEKILFTPKAPQSEEIDYNTVNNTQMPLFDESQPQKSNEEVHLYNKSNEETSLPSNSSDKTFLHNENKEQIEIIQPPVHNETVIPLQNEALAKEEIIENKEEIVLNSKVAVFYDDKASFIDYPKNKYYRLRLDLISTGADSNGLINEIGAQKDVVDTQTDEVGEVLKMFNTTNKEVSFITTSKSENILKTFVENGISFEIRPISTIKSFGKTIEIIPLFGLSNIYTCPNCSKKEYYINSGSKVLALQCKNCSSVMYPDVYEANGFETNSNPYYWINAANAMAKADTWILINPPFDSTKTLSSMFLKSVFEISKPKKVYIFSKETAKKEYYKQTFKEISEKSEIMCDYPTLDSLLEDYINNEISTKVLS